MASAGPAQSGKRSFDAEYNLVPFIDLLTCCICFLLISAVWTQIAKIDVKPTPNMAGSDQQQDQQIKLTVHIHQGGYYVLVNGAVTDVPKIGDLYPVKELDVKVGELRGGYPDVPGITVMADDAIHYKELIKVMDVCLRHQFNDINVAGS